MVWGYLQEFWNAITGVGEYTIEFFQNIGNAVAGAIGNLLEFTIHSLSDIFIFGGWFFGNIGIIFERLFLPIQFIFQLLKAFTLKAFATSIETNIWGFSNEIKEIFNTIPYWDTMIYILGIGIMIIAIVSIFKKILSI